MKKQSFTVEQDGYYGVFYPCRANSRKGIILMLGDSAEDRMAVSGAKWLHQVGCHVLATAPQKNDYGHHNYPLERIRKAIGFLQDCGCDRIGIIGASTTGMLALTAASCYPEISLTIAVSPSDFIMEGFIRDGKDGARERPADGESSVSVQGEPLPYLPFAYRHPEYWQKIREETKAGGDMVASRQLFDESEHRHPLQEEEMIKAERIRGRVICIGAEDDVLWDTCRYIRRMEERLDRLPHECRFEAWTYLHGTHFAFPQSMLKKILPVGSSLLVGMMFKAGREYPKECRRTRDDIDRKLSSVLRNW